MKIIHVPYIFYPDAVGGTEIYVAALARQLKFLNLSVVVVAPGTSDARYSHDGVQVRRFSTSTSKTLADMYGSGTESEAQGFLKIVAEERPDIVHLHAGTAAVGLRALTALKRQRSPIVLTHHVAAVTCQRGTLMRWGQEICDGEMRLDLCTRCTLHGLGLPRVGAAIAGRTPGAAGRLLGEILPPGRVLTALRMRELVTLRHASLRVFLSQIDHIVTVCNWSKRVLMANDIPEQKISVSRHALTQTLSPGMRSSPRDHSCPGPIKVAYVGRLDPIKGVDTLLRAFRQLVSADIELHIHGVIQGESGQAYYEDLLLIADGDPRITWESTVPPSDIIWVLRQYDVLAVPSRALETGPLVVLEAFAAGVPVIGSDLGGIAELITDEVNGLLLPPTSIRSWSSALQRIIDTPELLARLRRGIKSPRTMEQVASEMVTVYRRLLLPQRPAKPVASANGP